MHSYRTLFLYIAMKTNAGVYYGYYNDNDNYQYYCYSYYSSLSQCIRYYSYYGCGSYTDALGLVCANSTEGTHASYSYIVSACIDYIYNCTGNQECSNGDVRLVNGGRENRGRVEYCYNGQWSPMCSLSVTTARLICKSLGYEKYQC